MIKLSTELIALNNLFNSNMRAPEIKRKSTLIQNSVAISKEKMDN